MERAVRLAGALAELGVTRVTLVHADGRREDRGARATDLPGALCAGGVVRLECAGIVAEVSDGGLRIAGPGAGSVLSACGRRRANGR